MLSAANSPTKVRRPFHGSQVQERRKPKKDWWGIFALNFCFGWTVIGWFYLLVWAIRLGSTSQLMKLEDMRIGQLLREARRTGAEFLGWSVHIL